MWFWILVLVVVGLMGWVRLAPSDPAQWHVVPDVTANEDLDGGVKRRLSGDAETLARLEAIILDTPRTTPLAGDVASGHVTYVTRSLIWGFPDYATVRLADGQITIWSRLRFGRSDLGVNKARVDGWLKALGQG